MNNRMWRQVLGALVGAMGAVLVAHGPAWAQEPPPASEPPTLNQIKLTETQIQSFIKAQPDLAAIAEKSQGAETVDTAMQAELEQVAKKYGFKSLAEFDEVAANISMVMSGIDPQTGTFTDPVQVLQKELADVQVDKSIPEEDRKQLVDELNEAIKTTPPLKFKENIELIKAHRAELEKAMP